jgi:hypothetical protein
MTNRRGKSRKNIPTPKNKMIFTSSKSGLKKA